MRLTTKGRFAVTAMQDLASGAQDRPVTLAGISERQNISLSYLEQLFSRLRRKGLVLSVRGPGGGYLLAKPAIDITIACIISAADEKIDATQCGGHKNCRGDKPCSTHNLWSSLNEKILEHLSSVTLADLVEADGEQQPIKVSLGKNTPKAMANAS